VMTLDDDFHPAKLLRGVEHMGALVLGQLKEVLDAYAGHDLPKALAVWRGDQEVDAMCTSLFRELLTYMMEDPRTIGLCTHLLFVAKNIERSGDHATNIAEVVYHMVRADHLSNERPKADTTSETSVPFERKA
jgi:phosphate transport system protein